MPIEVEYEGTIHEFPDDFTDADIAAALGGVESAQTTAPVGAPTGELKPWNRSILDQALDYLPNRERLQEGIPGIIAGAIKQGINSVAQADDMVRAGYNALVPESLETRRPNQDAPAMPITNPYQQLGQRAVQGAELAAGANALVTAGKAAPGIVARAAGISKARAGANLTSATNAAKDVALGTDDVAREGARALELQAAGASLPRAASRLMRRIGDADQPLTFAEARDYYSNLSRLSLNDMGRLNPTMQRQIGAMTKALREALEQAAASVGKGEQYTAGMREYRRAAKAEEAWESVAPALWKTLKRFGAGAAAGVGAGGAYQAVTGG